MFPYNTVEVYFDDVMVLCPVIRSIKLRDGSFEVLVRIGNRLEYYTWDAR